MGGNSVKDPIAPAVEDQGHQLQKHQETKDLDGKRSSCQGLNFNMNAFLQRLLLCDLRESKLLSKMGNTFIKYGGESTDICGCCCHIFEAALIQGFNTINEKFLPL